MLEVLTLGRTRGGGGGCHPPIKLFFKFSKTIFPQHLPFSVAVVIPLRHNWT